ncbi:MAG: hypothetical protein WAO52_09450 [Prolixibacteraceae bacterium]
MDKNYKQFVNKLNAYIRKFYLYQLIRGFILFIVVTALYFSLISLLEYFSYFDPKVKLYIFILTILLTFFIFIYFLVVPILKLFGAGKRISYYDVSSLLSKTYPEIKDKLINVIELENETGSNYSYDLKKASIDQKIDELKIFQFSDAIKFKNLKVAFGVFLAVIIFLSVAFIEVPDVFTESSVRLVKFHQKFEKPAPFTFFLENTNLEIIGGESIELKLRCDGKEIPDAVFVNIGGSNFLMSREGNNFSYLIENLNSSISFYFTDKQYVSEIYRLNVLNKPFVSSFTVEITPPGYTNLASEILSNVGDLKIASGTNIKWTIKTVDADSLFLFLNDSSKIVGQKDGNVFRISDSFIRDYEYRIVLKNSKLSDDNNLVYKIQIVSDLYPEIKVAQIRDTLNFQIFHFKGNIVDDYGFSQLDFNLSSGEKDSLIKIPFTPFLLNQDFYFSFDFESVKSFGKSFKYYFSVRDNDNINHFKRSISETFSFNFPDYQEIVSKEESDLNSIDKLFDKSSKLTEEIQNEMKNFKKKQIESQVSDFDKFQMVKDIMNKKAELENVLNQIKQQNTDATNFLNSFSEEKSELLEKQKQIDELLNEVFSDDLKKLFEEFNELAKQFDSKKFEQLSKNMETSMEDLSKQLDKNMQLLKKMKVEQKVERVKNELEKLSITEKQLLEKLDKRSDLKEVIKTEKENESLIDNLEQDYNGALELNKSLDKPMNLLDFKKEFSTIKDNISKTGKDSENGNKRKTSSGIENNIKSIDQLSFAMNQMLLANKKKENSENIENLKQILDNLMTVSFDQEKILKNLSQMDYNNPLMNDLKLQQKNLKGQVEFVKDSLYALSKRAPEIGSIISKEILGLQNSVASSFESLDNGNIGGARMYQQYGITAANNLALFLSEALENIKKQQNQEGSGEGDCDKPGGKGSKPGLKELKDSQGSLKDQLQKMIDQMKKGDMGGLSKSIGESIAQQEIMQQMIKDLINGNSVGSGAKEQLKMVDQLLDQSRRDLINRNISQEMINRQNLILSKLLDAEKSEIERDQDDKRESKTAFDVKNSNPEGYFEYNRKQGNENEIIRRNNYKLKSFYDQKYNSFINKIKQ